MSSKFYLYLSKVFGCLMLSGVWMNTAAAVDLETALWYFERNDFVPAFLDFQILAAEGDPTAMYYMGRMYRQGYAVEKNLEEAEKWLRGGAEGGVPMAHHRLGWMYARGEIGSERDPETAVKHWKAAAKGGIGKAQSDLGVMYWNGTGIAQDLVRAYSWLYLASEEGGLSAAGQNLTNVASRMTDEEIAQGKALAEQLSSEIKSKP
jgi:TPR repeat protein